ncbi:MAG: Energy-coupling factor transporter transmembrane protein EcfT [Chroococcopsis gigantea SAG 12.99]|jgi:cobalt/nickel transport system permease protein|nr:cobalt ECF transporter T component CbiQ [Chlorogloea purpurea SAG 13.99]MDV3001905.1 Energy-coupling factor transporter transmembrane protein EcfT [Chroococcopsis gigantea SAG 12.99]
MLFHISAFQLDKDSNVSSPWHSLTARSRVICALLFVFATALTPNGHFRTWAVYAGGLLALISISHLTLSVLIRRVAVEFTFISVVLLGTLFNGAGQTLWSWGWFKITDTGLIVLGSVFTKAFLSLLMLNLLVLTTPATMLLNALADLKMPPLLVAILHSMYHYLTVLIDEFNAMRRAALSRNLTSRRNWHRLVIGNMIGSLFIRTYERGDRIHQAMLARGYNGIPPVQKQNPETRRDYLGIGLTSTLVIVGQLIHWRYNAP